MDIELRASMAAPVALVAVVSEEPEPARQPMRRPVVAPPIAAVRTEHAPHGIVGHELDDRRPAVGLHNPKGGTRPRRSHSGGIELCPGATAARDLLTPGVDACQCTLLKASREVYSARLRRGSRRPQGLRRSPPPRDRRHLAARGTRRCRRGARTGASSTAGTARLRPSPPSPPA